MESDDEAARKERVESLRQRIGELTSPKTESEAVAESDAEPELGDPVGDKKHAGQEAPSKQNLRELIDRRMRELDRNKR